MVGEREPRRRLAEAGGDGLCCNQYEGGERDDARYG
jgi:hypothetical protein